jgi:hypothetical protein
MGDRVSSSIALGRFGAVAFMALALALAGCLPYAGPGGSPAPVPSPTAPTVEPSPSGRPPAGGDDPRFLITCFYPDGSEVATFTRLEEAWASTNYVRIESCDAAVADPSRFELSSEEQAIAEVAAADVPDEDPTELYLQTLAACVRLSPEELASEPTSILEATVLLCPEAPHAGLIQQELTARPGSQ